VRKKTVDLIYVHSTKTERHLIANVLEIPPEMGPRTRSRAARENYFCKLKVPKQCTEAENRFSLYLLNVKCDCFSLSLVQE
jgi:hypothetical protein